MTVPNILLVDDDVDSNVMLCEFLESESFRVESALTGTEGLERALSGKHDAVILDIMIPRLNGIEVLRQIRQSSNIPIVMLTARGDQVDRVVGLELGADDYVAKPYYPRELVARLRAIIRRHAPAEPPASTLARGALYVQVGARRAAWRDTPIELTASEFNLLVELMRTGEDVATKDHLSLQALHRVRQSYDRSVDVHVSNLRLKLEAIAPGAIVIETIRGVGYRLKLAS